MNSTQFAKYIVIPTLDYLQLNSTEAINLVMGTIAQESRFVYLHQFPIGPALGVGQMETATHDDIWQNYLRYAAHHDLAEKIYDLVPAKYLNGEDEAPDSHALIGCLEYAVAMIRVHYRRAPLALPAANDLPGQAQYYKRFYNTAGGAATIQEYVNNYRRLVNLN